MTYFTTSQEDNLYPDRHRRHRRRSRNDNDNDDDDDCSEDEDDDSSNHTNIVIHDNSDNITETIDEWSSLDNKNNKNNNINNGRKKKVRHENDDTIKQQQQQQQPSSSSQWWFSRHKLSTAPTNTTTTTIGISVSNSPSTISGGSGGMVLSEHLGTTSDVVESLTHDVLNWSLTRIPQVVDTTNNNTKKEQKRRCKNAQREVRRAQQRR